MGSDSTTLSRMVFVVASLDANKKDARYNISGRLNDGDSPVTRLRISVSQTPIAGPFILGAPATRTRTWWEEPLISPL